MIFNKKSFFFIILLIISFTKIFGQTYKIDYYGIVSTEIDSNMAKMTSDLYYTQLSEISNFDITDKRSTSFIPAPPDTEDFSNQTLSFYTTIAKDSDSDTWITVYHVVDKQNNEEHTKRKEYDSFYKILMESKNILKDTIKNLIENDSKATVLASVKTQEKEAYTKPNSIISTESLSGTWTGEENINKIVILRGGRGFIIFKNGASMNVTVSISEKNSSEIIIAQNGKANASFYPELPRNIALKAALSVSDPIKWILKLSDDNTLSGNKETLLPDDSGENYITGALKVIWHKSN